MKTVYMIKHHDCEKGYNYGYTCSTKEEAIQDFNSIEPICENDEVSVTEIHIDDNYNINNTVLASKTLHIEKHFLIIERNLDTCHTIIYGTVKTLEEAKEVISNIEQGNTTVKYFVQEMDFYNSTLDIKIVYEATIKPN